MTKKPFNLIRSKNKFFETFLKSTFVLAKIYTFSKVVVLIKKNGLWVPSEDLISKLGFKEETTTLQNEHFYIQTVEIGPGGWWLDRKEGDVF